MSYDVYLKVPSSSSGHMTEVFWRNHTSNTSQMWREAGCDIAEFDGMTASSLIPPLERAITEISTNRSRYKQYEPDNGWGSIDSTLSFLGDILDACRQHDLAIVRVSR